MLKSAPNIKDAPGLRCIGFLADSKIYPGAKEGWVRREDALKIGDQLNREKLLDWIQTAT